MCNISSTGNIAFVFLSTYFQCHFDYTGFSSWTSQYQIPRFTSWLFGFQSTKMVFCHVFRLSQCWYLVFNGPSWVPAQWAGVTRGHLLLICFLLIGISLLLLCIALTLVSEPCFCHEGPCRGCQYLYWDLATTNDGVPASVNTTLPPPSRPPLVSIFSKQLLIALPPIYNCLWCAHFHNSPVKCMYFEPNLTIWCDVNNCKLGHQVCKRTL